VRRLYLEDRSGFRCDDPGVDGDTGGIGCVYRADSKQLFAAEEFTDTLVSCGADLVSFVFAVYGEDFRCTDLRYVTVDAGL
jgi:hypothetical protein